MYLLYSLSLLLAASSGYCQRVPLEPVNPDSRLAAWSQSYDGTIPADCSDESASGEKLKTVIYYQQDGGHLDDASKIGSGDWTQGSLTAQAREKSPLAVVHWVDGRLGDVVLLYYVDIANQYLTEKAFYLNEWQPSRLLGPVVHINPALPGSMSAVVKDDVVQIFYRGSANEVDICKYTFSSTSPTVSCESNGPRWTDALDGTSTAGFLDEDDLPHFFYQEKTAFSTVEVYYDGANWKTANAGPNSSKGLSFTGLLGRMPEDSRWPAQNRHLLIGEHGAIGWEMWSPLCYCGSSDWCGTRPTPGVPGGAFVGLASSGCTSNMRLYWVNWGTSAKGISEMSTTQTGWSITNTDILIGGP